MRTSAGAKLLAQAVLKKAGLYERVQASFLYDLYWKMVDPSVLEERDREGDFYRQTLQGLTKGAIIFDVGANIGYKASTFVKMGAKVICIEPDESNQMILKRKFKGKPVVIVGKAVSDKDGIEALLIDTPGSAKNTLSRKWASILKTDRGRLDQDFEFSKKQNVATITLDHPIEIYGRPYFIKIDVEGYEPQVLRGLSSCVPFVSFEVNLPEFIAEGNECLQLLSGLSSAARFNYFVNCRKGFESKLWLSSEDMTIVLNQSRVGSFEIVCRTQTD